MTCRKARRELLERFRFGEERPRVAKHLEHLQTCLAARRSGWTAPWSRCGARCRRAWGYDPSPSSWQLVERALAAERALLDRLVRAPDHGPAGGRRGGRGGAGGHARHHRQQQRRRRRLPAAGHRPRGLRLQRPAAIGSAALLAASLVPAHPAAQASRRPDVRDHDLRQGRQTVATTRPAPPRSPACSR